MNGQTREVGPFAAFFRVNNGKIQEWLDIPLVAEPKVMIVASSGDPNVRQSPRLRGTSCYIARVI